MRLENRPRKVGRGVHPLQGRPSERDRDRLDRSEFAPLGSGRRWLGAVFLAVIAKHLQVDVTVV